MERRRRRLSSVLLPVSLAGLLLGAAACGSSGGGSGSGAAAANSKDTSLDSMTPEQLAAQAQQEGSVTWYTTFADDDVQPMVDAFNEKYPNVKVNPLRLSADKIPQRIITEQKGGKHNADVVSGDSPQVAQLLQAGALQPYTPKDQAQLPSGLDLPQGYEGVIYIVTTAVGYNPKLVKQKGLPLPKSWEDLTNPAWKGQFSIDPGAVNWYDSLIQSMGHDKALDLLKRLGDNQPVFVESHTQALTQVQAGEPLAAATIYGYKASSLREEDPGHGRVHQLQPAARVADARRRGQGRPAPGGRAAVRGLAGVQGRPERGRRHHQPHLDPAGREERPDRVGRAEVAAGLGQAQPAFERVQHRAGRDEVGAARALSGGGRRRDTRRRPPRTAAAHPRRRLEP